MSSNDGVDKHRFEFLIASLKSKNEYFSVLLTRRFLCSVHCNTHTDQQAAVSVMPGAMLCWSYQWCTVYFDRTYLIETGFFKLCHQ